MDPEFGPAVVAIFTADLQGLSALLEQDTGLAARRSSCGHPTLLQLVACEAATVPNPAQVAEILLDAGAPGAEPLVAAAGCNAREVLDTLLAAGVPVDNDGPWSALDEALYWCNREIARHLLTRGARVRALRAAAALGDFDRVQGYFDGDALLPGAGPITSPFPDTIRTGEAGAAQAIVDNAFVAAVNTGQGETAALLLEKGAQINAKPPGYHWRGTALHAAIWRGDRVLTKWLLRAGADPSIRDDMVDSDALGWARHHQRPELVALVEAHR